MSIFSKVCALTTLFVLSAPAWASAETTYEGTVQARKSCVGHITGQTRCNTLSLPSKKRCTVKVQSDLRSASFDIADLQGIKEIRSGGYTGSAKPQLIFAENNRSKHLAHLNLSSNNAPQSFEIKAHYTISKQDYRDYTYESYVCAGLRPVRAASAAQHQVQKNHSVSHGQTSGLR